MNFGDLVIKCPFSPDFFVDVSCPMNGNQLNCPGCSVFEDYLSEIEEDE